MQLLHLERDEGIHIIIVITVLLLQCHVQCGHVQIVNYSSTSCCYFRKLQMTLFNIFINFLMLIIVCIIIIFFSGSLSQLIPVLLHLLNSQLYWRLYMGIV